MVVDSIQVLGTDNETVIAELQKRDDGLAANVRVNTDCYTPEQLDNLSTAFSRMAAKIRLGGD